MTDQAELIAPDLAQRVTGFPITPDDTVIIGLSPFVDPTTILVTAKILLPDGRIVWSQDQFSSSSLTAEERFQFALPFGLLIAFSARVTSANANPNQAFVRVLIGRGKILPSQPFITLTQGYCDAIKTINWPYQLSQNSDDGLGFDDAVQAAPAAGNPALFPVPANQFWKVIGVFFHFTASVAAGTRIPFLGVVNANGVYSVSGVSLNAGNTANIYLVNGSNNAAPAGQGIAAAPAIDAYCPPNNFVIASVLNMQAADQIDGPATLWIKRYIAHT